MKEFVGYRCKHCIAVGRWSSWSACSVTCGAGVITRHRSCPPGPPAACETVQRNVCVREACRPGWPVYFATYNWYLGTARRVCETARCPFVCLSQHGRTAANPLLEVCCCGPGGQEISISAAAACSGRCHVVNICDGS